MVDLVLKRAGEQARALALLGLTAAVEPSEDDALGPDDGRVEAGHAETSFFFELHAVALDELRVDHHDESTRVTPDGEIDDEDP